MRHLRLPRLVKKVFVLGLLLGGYVLADGGGQTAGACIYTWPSCTMCQDAYDETLWSCRGGCSFGDYACWYDMCEAAANAQYQNCQNCCIYP